MSFQVLFDYLKILSLYDFSDLYQLQHNVLLLLPHSLNNRLLLSVWQKYYVSELFSLISFAGYVSRQL